jgi:hypothetical protein
VASMSGPRWDHYMRAAASLVFTFVKQYPPQSQFFLRHYIKEPLACNANEAICSETRLAADRQYCTDALGCLPPARYAAKLPLNEVIRDIIYPVASL